MTISIVIMTSKESQECQIFINSDLNFNIIYQSLMKKWRINFNWESKRHPFAINEKKLFDYNIYDFKIYMYDCNEQMNIYCRFFHIVKILKINIILSYSWLYAVNPEINWKKQVWQYSINLRQIFIIDSEKFALKMKKIR